LKTDLGLRLSYCYKRLGQWDNAVELWERLLSEGQFRYEPFEELAKYYDHHIRDYKKAEQIVQKALKNLEMMEQLRRSQIFNDYRKSFVHRLERIQRKMGEKEE